MDSAPYFWSLSRINSSAFLSGNGTPDEGSEGVPNQNKGQILEHRTTSKTLLDQIIKILIRNLHIVERKPG